MRENKIIVTCDICKKVVDGTNASSIGILHTEKLITKINFNNKQMVGGRVPELNTNKEVSSQNLDICSECLEKIENFIITIKK